MTVKFKRVTKGKGLKGVLDRLEKMTDIKVGVLSGTGEYTNSDHGQTVAEIAFYNEFGTKNTPARPFLRVTIRENRFKIKKKIADLYEAVAVGDMTAAKAQKVLGGMVASLVREKITTLQSPPNAPYTIERKGSANPLFDTGELKNSISWDTF
jgi:HK97 gp10 family phage protein